MYFSQNATIGLASKSPRRIELLKLLGINFEIITNNNIELKPNENELPKPYSIRTSNDKLKKLDTDNKKFIIAADTIIAFQNQIQNKSIKNPVKFFDTFIFQFVNPKGVIIAIITISTFVEAGSNYLFHTLVVLGVSFFAALTSITSWCLLGKFLRRFATNKKFIQWFNYVMSVLLIVCVIMFYI